jgi:predicted transcriptional regulator of viral defense system
MVKTAVCRVEWRFHRIFLRNYAGFHTFAFSNCKVTDKKMYYLCSANHGKKPLKFHGVSYLKVRKIMAKSLYKSKTLTIPQMDFLKFLDAEEILFFTKEWYIRQPAADEGMIENLISKGFLHRLERGKYCRTTFWDENVIGTFVVPDGSIAYWSALHLHGLTEQFPNTVFVQTTLKKNSTTILGTSYRFVKISATKKTGISYNGYGNYKYPITDVEKTIVDCFDLPQYSGGYAELIRAFAQAKPDAEKLIDYCLAAGNIAVFKRIGFLAELFDKKDLIPFVEFARTKINRTYNLFDPFGDDAGDPETAWYLRLNLSKDAIKGIIQNVY